MHLVFFLRDMKLAASTSSSTSSPYLRVASSHASSYLGFFADKTEDDEEEGEEGEVLRGILTSPHNLCRVFYTLIAGHNLGSRRVPS